MKLPDLDLRLFLPKPPFWLIAVAVIGLVASWVPLSLFLKHRFSFHDEPRIHLWQDMDNQPKLKAQASTPVFDDGRAMRPAVPGTVARGHLDADDHLARGFVLTANGSEVQTEYLRGFPEQLAVDELFVQRGQLKYDTMCAVCHGYDGRGNGTVNTRGTELQMNKDPGISLGTAWVPAASLLAEDETTGRMLYGPELYAEGKLYNTITNGKGNMAGYGHALSVEDRWAIVAYVRALQFAQKPEQVRSAWNRLDQAETPALADRD